MNQNLNVYVHDVLKDHIKPNHICLDATCGNGHDTLFLAQQSKQVYAFDIQEEAIEATRRKLEEHNITNVQLFHTSHDLLIPTLGTSISFDTIVYNLGYLPHSDKQIITTAASTIASLEQAITLLSKQGLIAVSVYTGHDGGLDEANALEEYVSTLDKHTYTVLKSVYLNRRQAPYVIFIQKA